MAARRHRTMSFQYTDAVNVTHGPLRVSVFHTMRDLSPLYRQRALRKYHSICVNNQNTIIPSLYLWKPFAFRYPYLDAWWQLKFFSTHSYHLHRLKYTMRLFVPMITIFMHLLYMDALYLPWNCTCLVVVITVPIVCRIILEMYTRFVRVSSDYPASIGSRYCANLKSKYANLGKSQAQSLRRINHQLGGGRCSSWSHWCKKSLFLVFAIWNNLMVLVCSGNVLNWRAYNYWIREVLWTHIHGPVDTLLAILWFLVAVVATVLTIIIVPVGVLVVVNNSYDPILHLQWVVPDRYDIQNDISHFVLRPFMKLECIRDDPKMLHAIYHILNAVVADVVSNVLRLENETRFCRTNCIKSCSQVREQHVQCIAQHLRRRYSVYPSPTCETNDIDDGNDVEREPINGKKKICGHDEHHFNHRQLCYANYEQFMQIHGFMIRDRQHMSTAQLLGALLFRNYTYFCPVLPIVLCSYIVRWCVYNVWYEQHSNALSYDMFRRVQNVTFWIVVLSVFLLWLEPIYIYLFSFQQHTKEMIFWMDGNLLTYHNVRFGRYVEERMLAYMVRMSGAVIKNYVCLVKRADPCYNAFVHSHYGLSMDVIQLILDYVVEYECVEKSMQNDVNDSAAFASSTRRNLYDFDAQELRTEIDELVSQCASSTTTDQLQDNDRASVIEIDTMENAAPEQQVSPHPSFMLPVHDKKSKNTLSSSLLS